MCTPSTIGYVRGYVISPFLLQSKRNDPSYPSPPPNCLMSLTIESNKLFIRLNIFPKFDRNILRSFREMSFYMFGFVVLWHNSLCLHLSKRTYKNINKVIQGMSDCETKLSGSASPVGVTLIACQD